ncbi:MAG: Cache domain, partial [Pseudomonadota bacterium]
MSGKLDEAAAQAEALTALRSLRYSGQEYFWVNDLQTRMASSCSASSSRWPRPIRRAASSVT